MKFLEMLRTNIISFFKVEEKVKFKVVNKIVWGENEEEIFNLINKYRENHNKSLLEKDDSLYIVAKSRAFFLKGKDTTIENFGCVKDHLMSIGVKKIGENKAYRWTTNKGVVKKWLNNKESHSNLLRDWKWTGIAVLESEEGLNIYCQIFAK